MNRMDSLRRHRGTALRRRLFEIRLAPEAVGLLVTLLNCSSNTPHPWGLGTCCGCPSPCSPCPSPLWSLDFPLSFTLEAQSVHVNGNGVHRHDLRTSDLGHFQPQLLVGVQSRGVQHHVPAQRFLLQPVNEECQLSQNRGWRSWSVSRSSRCRSVRLSWICRSSFPTTCS